MFHLVPSIQRQLAAGIVVCFALLGAASPASAGPLAFTGFEPGTASAAVVGDINGDGFDDHATASAGRVTIRLGAAGNATGGGSFAITSTGTVPDGESEVNLVPAPAGDLDDDGVDDLIVAGDAGYSYIVYGARGAASPLTLSAGPRVAAIERGKHTTTSGSSASLPGPNTGIGDFDGDGIDDAVIDQATGNTNFDGTLGVAIVRGGPRLATLSLRNGPSPRASLISGYKKCFTAWLYWVIPVPTCTVFTPGATPVGDVNGDGKADLLVDGVYGKSQSIVFGRSQPGTISAITPGAGSVSLAQRVGNSSFGRYTTGPAGDVNGDGFDDLHVTIGGTSPSDPPRSAILRGKASFPATLPATEPLISFTLGGAFATYVRGPIGDQDGDGRDDLLLDVQLASGQPAELRVAGLAAGASAVNPLANQPLAGSDVPTILYAGEPGVRLSDVGDLDGDRAPDAVLFAGSRAHRLTHGAGPGPTPTPSPTPTGGPTPTPSPTATPSPTPAPGPASFEVETTATMPDGLPVAGTVISRIDCGPIGDGAELEGHALGTTRQLALRAAAASGDSCTIDWGALNVPSAKGCSWTITSSHEGRDLDPAGNRFTANPGPNRLKTRFVCVGGTRLTEGAVPNFDGSVAGWRRYGASDIGNGWASLPWLGTRIAPKDAAGSVVWATPINPNNWKYSFTLTMSGGNGAAEGVTMAFLPTSAGTPPTSGSTVAPGFLGTARGGLGVGGLGGAAVAFDVSPGTGDPAAQFIGLTDTVPNGSSLNWLATATSSVRLRGPAVKIDVVTKDGELTVSTNGSLRLRRAVTLPSSAYLAFTGSTNAAVYQNQSVANLTMTRP